MRYKIKISPRVGTIRTIKKFLLFPKEINSEIRWLETVFIKQEMSVIDFPDGDYTHGWINIEWIN